MEKVDLIIHGKHMYTMEGGGVGYRADSSVAIDRGIIKAIASKEEIIKTYEGERVIDATDKVIMPGFIDGHMHTGHGVLRGVAQDINNWMMHGMAPFEAKRSAAGKTAGSKLAIAEAIMNGTTTIGDDGSSMEGACEFIYKVGVRGNISVRVRDAVARSYSQGELYEFRQELRDNTINECLELFEKYHNVGNERIKIRFSPQGADFVSEDTLDRVKIMAKEKQTKIHMHLQQGSRETKQMMMRYGVRTIPFLEAKGYFDEDFIGIHLTDAEDEEASLVAKRGASMILCSASIGIIDGIVPPAKVFYDAGGYVGLGSDQAPGNNCHNIINEMKMTAILNKVKYADPEVMPAWQVLRMATIDGAKALGIDNLTGSLKEGKQADIILVDLRQASLAPFYTVPMRNFVPNLVYSGRGNEVDTVIVAGKVLVEGRKPITFNMDNILNEVQGYADVIGREAATQFWEINGVNAKYMREDKL